MLSLEQQLTMVENYDTLDEPSQDRVTMMIGQSIAKRFKDMADVDVLDYHKKVLKDIFDGYCEKEIEAGFTFTGNNHKYRCNRDDQINMIGRYLYLKDNTSVTQVFWKTEDVGTTPMSVSEFMSMYAEALQHKDDTIKHYWEKKNEIDACTTHEAIRAVVWR